MQCVSVYMKQAKKQSVHQQNSNLVDALKNASIKTCFSEILKWVAGEGWNLRGGLLLECSCNIINLLFEKQRHHHHT